MQSSSPVHNIPSGSLSASASPCSHSTEHPPEKKKRRLGEREEIN